MSSEHEPTISPLISGVKLLRTETYSPMFRVMNMVLINITGRLSLFRCSKYSHEARCLMGNQFCS